MRTTIAMLAVASLILIGVSVAQAAPTQVNVRIEGKTKTLFEGPILTEGHDVRSFKADGGNAAEDIAEHPCNGVNPLDPENVSPGPTSTAASVDAMNLIGETDALAGQWYPGYDDYYVKQWGAEEENAEKDGKAWGILVNNVFTDVGGCQYQLSEGDEVLWVYNAFESRPFLALLPVEAHYASGDRALTATAQLNKPFEVEVLEYNDDKEDRPPATPQRTGAEPLEGADVSPVRTSEKGFETLETKSPATVTTGEEGKASITFTEPGWHRIMAGTALNGEGEEEAIRSNRLDVCVPAVDQTSCGEPPAEDQVRALPQYLEKGKEEHHESGENPGGEQPGTGGSPGNGQPDSSGTGITPAAPSTQTPAQSASNPAAELLVASVSPTQLVLKLTTAGKATVKIMRQVSEVHHRRWQIVKTITVTANKAGQVKVKLGQLAAGHYRVSISFDGGTGVVRTLTVPRR
jgi:hypothetical protein